MQRSLGEGLEGGQRSPGRGRCVRAAAPDDRHKRWGKPGDRGGGEKGLNGLMTRPQGARSYSPATLRVTIHQKGNQRHIFKIGKVVRCPFGRCLRSN